MIFVNYTIVEASKVELLKQENRRLINERNRAMGQPLKQESTTDQNDSWEDSDEVGLNPVNNAESAGVLENSSAGVLREVEEDEDVRKVVAMLENVEFNDTLGLTLPEDDNYEDNENKTYTLQSDSAVDSKDTYKSKEYTKGQERDDGYSSKKRNARSRSPEGYDNDRRNGYSDSNGHHDDDVGKGLPSRTARISSGFRLV